MMQEITSSELEKLLQNSFKGEIELFGKISCRLDNQSQQLCYEHSGNFSLVSADNGYGMEEGSYLIKVKGVGEQSTFYFTPTNRESIRLQKGIGTEIITFQTKHPPEAIMKIEGLKKIRF